MTRAPRYEDPATTAGREQAVRLINAGVKPAILSGSLSDPSELQLLCNRCGCTMEDLAWLIERWPVRVQPRARKVIGRSHNEAEERHE